MIGDQIDRPVEHAEEHVVAARCLGDQHGGHQALGKFDGSFKLSVALMEVRLSPIWLLSYILSPPLLLPHVW